MKPLRELVSEARRPDRFLFKKMLTEIFDEYIELHGDRLDNDDQSISSCISSIDDRTVMVIGINKGVTAEENLRFNFGSPRPSGYRKVERMIDLATKFNFPIVTFINTPGASASVEDEYNGQSSAIGNLIKKFGSAGVPTISIFTGEGESGGALALSNTDKIFMFENSIFSVASPEAFSSILFKNNSDVDWEELNKLPMTAEDLFNLNLCDEVILEHEDLKKIYKNVRAKIIDNISLLNKISSEDRIQNRQEKLNRFTKVGLEH